MMLNLILNVELGIDLKAIVHKLIRPLCLLAVQMMNLIVGFNVELVARIIWRMSVRLNMRLTWF